MQMSKNEFAYVGYSYARGLRDAKDKELKALGYLTKRSMLPNQYVNGTVGNVYYVRIIGDKSAVTKPKPFPFTRKRK